MDYPFEGIPTIPPRKDVDHMVSPELNTSLNVTRMFRASLK